MDIAALLRRINYTGTIEPNESTLRALHRAFLMSVPFENLDIHLGRPIALDEEKWFHKIVECGRGGFCYELNGLFAGALRQLGFDVRLLSAGVYDPRSGRGREFAHLLLLVQLENAWIADVGFGDWFTEPIRFELAEVQIVDATSYRVVSRNDRYDIEMKRDAEDWRPRYSFTTVARRLGDFAAMCEEQQTASDSYFRSQRICTRPTSNGRITLTDGKLIVTTAGERVERVLGGEDEFARALELHFGIGLSAPLNCCGILSRRYKMAFQTFFRTEASNV